MFTGIIAHDIKNGISKYQTAKELDISYPTVLRIAKHLPSHPRGRIGIRGQTLEMLQELVAKGYIFCTPGASTLKYHTLRSIFQPFKKLVTNIKVCYFLKIKHTSLLEHILINILRK